MIWLQEFIGDPIATNQLLYVIGSVLGAIGHWCAKWLNGEIACVTDMATTRRKRSFAAFAAQVSAAGVVVATGAVEAVSPGSALISGLFQGTALDALVNKGRRAEWSDEVRKTKGVAPGGSGRG